tara:strand:+ start:10530 stop:10805 length:276 start_codon:yes stop_codon:yes gene_type:complete
VSDDDKNSTPVRQFNALVQSERSLWEAKEDAELDVRLATRRGIQAEIDVAHKKHAAASTDWHEAYKKIDSAKKNIFKQLGFSAQSIERVIK